MVVAVAVGEGEGRASQTAVEMFEKRADLWRFRVWKSAGCGLRFRRVEERKGS